MRAMKRTVSVLLSLMLVLGMMTIGMSAVSAAETNSIEVTSNLGAGGEAQYTENSEQVTVTFKLKTDVSIVNTQSVLTFDPTVLKIASTNTEATVMPNFSGAIVNLTKTDGRLPMNWANYQGTDAFNGTEAVYAVVVFDILKSGVDTTVNLEVSDLTGNTDPQGGVKNDVKIIETYEEINDTTRYTATVDEKVTPDDEPIVVDSSVFIWNVGVAMEGKIGLNYYFYKTVAGFEDKAISVQFDGPEGNKGENKTVAYPEMDDSVRSGVTYKKYTYHVYPDMMTQPVKANIIVDGKVVASHTISVEGWATEKRAALEASTPAQAKVVKAMLNYGAAVQNMFNSFTDDLANKNQPDYPLQTIAADTIATPAGVDVAPDLTSMGLTWNRRSVELKDGTAIRLYATISDSGKYTDNQKEVDVNGKKYSFAGTNTQYVIYADIASDQLDDVYPFTFANGATYKLSALYYAKLMIQSGNDAYVKLGSAMYWYNQAANEAFAN